MIGPFRYNYYFLSNFYPVELTAWGKKWPTAEHIYQAIKTTNLDEREMIRTCGTPGNAKRMGNVKHGVIHIREDWDALKEDYMVRIIKIKFKAGTEMARLLLATGDEELVEVNWWHDQFWGRCICARCNNQGHNRLGKILMDQRTRLRTP